MAYNSLSGTIIGPDKIVAKADGTFTQLTGTISGSYIDSEGIAVSFATIGTSDGGTIGASEDGTYNDGLFEDFHSGTLIGVPVDRFNELFKSLVPPPAPSVSRADATQDGTDAYLSFGTSNDMSGDSPAYHSVGTTAGFSAVNKGGLYQTDTSGNNFRRSIFKLDTDITGFINFNVTASVLGSNTNYEADAFGNAEVGSLQLFINSTSTSAHTLNLATAVGAGNPGAGSSSSLDSDGSGFTNISISSSALDANSNSFSIFQHRTAKYIVSTTSQRRGWNYAFIRHTVGTANYNTNYIEWVNDDNSTNVTITGDSLTNIALVGSRYLSGVQYNTSATANYQFLISNFYNNVYDLATVTCSDSTNNVSITNGTMPHIGGDDENKTVALTQSVSTSDTIILNENIGATSSVSHIFKGSATSNTNMSGFLIFTPSVSDATDTIEYFKEEGTYRLPSASYNTQVSITLGSWNSETHLTVSGDHSDGLQIYNQRLVSPLNTTNGGNFSSISNTEAGNPNYSGISGTRTFYRAFKNTGSDVRDIGVRIKGSSTIVSSAASLGSNGNIRVFVKTPGKTDWMNLADDFSFNDVSEDAGANELGLDAAIDGTGAYNVATLGTKVVATGEYFLVRFEADAGWTGNVTEISTTFGAGASGNPTYGASMDEINENTSNNGSTANLSFGSSKSISGYTNVTSSPSINGAVDVNGTWSPNTGLTNQRLGVYNKAIDITALINDSAETYRIDSGSAGILSVKVNGTQRHSIDFSNFGSGNSLNAAGSGFTGVSAVAYPQYGNNVHDYTRPFRTGSLIIDTSEQRNGWNYVQIIHSGTWGELPSNYIEWVNDDDSSTISIAGGNITSFDNDGTYYYSSGIKHFATVPSASFSLTSSNNYKNVYDNDSSDAIDFNDNLTNVTISAMTASGAGVTTLNDANGASAYPTLLASSDAETESVNYDVTLQLTPTTSLVGGFVDAGDVHTASIGRVKFLQPPFNGNDNTYSQFTTPDFVASSRSGFLRFSGSESSTNETSAEYFQGEGYRLENRNVTYLSQANVTNAGNAWNSESPINDTASYDNYADGLVVFGDKLVAPVKAGSSGDCRNISNGGTLQSPVGNVNYSLSELDIATRTYVRYIKNSTGTTKTGFTITFRGSGSVDDLATSYAGGAFKFEYKIPHSDSNNSTAWQDGGKALSFSGNKNVDGNGGAQGSDSQFPLTISAGGTAINVSFNGGNWLNNQYMLIRIRASASWDGYLDRIEVT
jgi:hypothetical protein